MKEECANCGVAKTLKIIGSKWTIMILYQLFDGPKRFSELQSNLEISPRTLSMRLQQLESDKIINKKVYTEVPLKVEYTLTEKGSSLNHIISTMNEWGEVEAASLSR